MAVSVDDTGRAKAQGMTMPHVTSHVATQLVHDASAVPGIIERRPFSPQDQMIARSNLGLANLPTVVAMGPFDDLVHANQLGAAFTAVARRCTAQLVLLGTGARRGGVVPRAYACGIESRIHRIEDSSRRSRWDLVAAADVVVPSTASGLTVLLGVMAAGRAVFVMADPITVPLVVPNSAGLVYRPGDVSGMARALLRLLTIPALRNGIATRAREVACQHHLQRITQRHHTERNEHA